MAASGSDAVALSCSSRPTSRGVNKMPSKVESEALQMEIGILARASAVCAIADCTVAGTVHKKNAGVQLGCDQGLQQRAQNPAQQGEGGKGNGRHHQVQPSMAYAGQDGGV